MAAIEDSELHVIPSGEVQYQDGTSDHANSRDSRKMALYKKGQGDAIARNDGRYLWLAESTAGKATTLLREVPCEMNGSTGLVKFTKYCVEHETEYVLAEIRRHA
jgi:hypothetical protein